MKVLSFPFPIGLIVLFVGNFSFAQKLTLCGQVRDKERGTPIAGVEVIVRGTSYGVLTDTSGSYCLELPLRLKEKILLQFHHVAYERIDTFLHVEGHLNQMKLDIELIPRHFSSEEVTIVAKRSGIETLQGSMVLESDIASFRNYQGVDQVLATFPGVWLQQTTPTTYRPFLLGMGDLRVATIVDHVLVENQSLSSDHGLPMVSEGSDRLEVYYGPNNLPPAYDALGGTFRWTMLDFHSPSRDQFRFQTEVSSGYNGGRSFLKWKRHLSEWDGDFVLVLGGQYNGNMTLPQHFLDHSGSQRVMMASGLSKHWERVTSSLVVRYWNDHNQIPHFEHEDEHITEHRFSLDERYPLLIQTNLLISNTSQFSWGNWMVTPTLGFFQNQIREFEHTSVAALSMLTRSYSLNLPFIWSGAKDHYFALGIYSSFQHLENSGEEEFLPAYWRFIGSVPFAFQKTWRGWAIHIRSRLTYGRYQRTDSLELTLNYLTEQIAVGIHRQLGRYWNVRLEGIRGARMPSPIELYALGPHHIDRTYLIGSDSLRPERVHQIFLLNEVQMEDLSFHFLLYSGVLENWLLRVGGKDTIEDFPVFRFQNHLGRLTGFNFYLHYHPHQAHWLHIEGILSFIRMQFSLQEAFVQLPQSRLSLRVRGEKKWKQNKGTITLEGNWLESVAYDYLPFSLPDAFYGNARADFFFATRRGTWFLAMGVNNLFNRPYYESLSTLALYALPMYGRHGYIQLGYQL
jgi:iron complex outermembrane receptor protein